MAVEVGAATAESVLVAISEAEPVPTDPPAPSIAELVACATDDESTELEAGWEATTDDCTELEAT